MPYLRNEPIATDDLDVSQPKLANNTNLSDDSFGVDHYKFSDLTANNGFHNRVTTPLIVGAAHPTTDATHEIFYCMQDSAEVGLLQYSRGISNAVPTPVTCLQSPTTPISLLVGMTTNVADFKNISNAMFTLHMSNMSTTNSYVSEWTGWWLLSANTFLLTQVAANGPNSARAPQATSTGSILQVIAPGTVNLPNVFWTLRFHRIWT